MSDPSMPPSSSDQPGSYPPGTPPVAEYGAAPLAYEVPPAQLRPTSVTVIAICGIIVAAMGLICAPISVIGSFVKTPPGSNPTMDVMRDNALIMGWTYFALVAQFLLALLLLAGSIFSLKLAPWARKAMLTWAIASLLLIVVGTALQFVFVIPKLLAQMNGGTPQQKGAAIGGVIGAVVGLVVGLILPTFTLLWYRKPHVIEAFDRGAAYRA